MKTLLLAATLGAALAATAAPAPTSAPVAPATPAARAAAAGIPPECIERLRAHAEKMKKELGLTEAQAAAVRDEAHRHHSQLLTARADHRSAMAKILTPEQMAKLDGKRSEMRQKHMDACAMDDDDDASKRKGKGRH